MSQCSQLLCLGWESAAAQAQGIAGCFSLAAATHSRMRVASSLRTSTTDGGSSELEALRSRQMRRGHSGGKHTG